MSLPEVPLWNCLRRSPDGIHFRRQHPLGPYVLDFYCAAAKLAIEIDGMNHDTGHSPVRDAERDAWLATQGIITIRIPASEVLKSAEDVAQTVMRRCQ